MEECNGYNTPAVKTSIGVNENKELTTKKHASYRALIGSLIWLATMTRPDIAYAVNKLTRVMHHPTTDDWIAAKRVLRYLKQTSQLGLTYHQNGNKEVIGYSDSDWAGDIKDRKSTSGYAFILGNAAISWSSRKQSTITLSSTKAEFIAASAATQKAIYLRQIFKDLKRNVQVPMTLRMDSQGAMN